MYCDKGVKIQKHTCFLISVDYTMKLSCLSDGMSEVIAVLLYLKLKQML